MRRGLSMRRERRLMKPVLLLILLLMTNLFCFGLMWRDKRAARRGARRVPEKTLFIACACFGGVGGVLGMQLLRHKTRHWYFRLFFPLMMIAQSILALLAATRLC